MLFLGPKIRNMLSSNIAAAGFFHAPFEKNISQNQKNLYCFFLFFPLTFSSAYT